MTEVGVSTASNNPWKTVDPPTLAEQAKAAHRDLPEAPDAGVPVLTVHRFVDLNFDSGDDPSWERNVGAYWTRASTTSAPTTTC